MIKFNFSLKNITLVLMFLILSVMTYNVYILFDDGLVINDGILYGDVQILEYLNDCGNTNYNYKFKMDSIIPILSFEYTYINGSWSWYGDKSFVHIIDCAYNVKIGKYNYTVEKYTQK